MATPCHQSQAPQTKVYELTLADPMNEDAQAHAVTSGKRHHAWGDTEKTRPAELEFIDDTHARLH